MKNMESLYILDHLLKAATTLDDINVAFVRRDGALQGDVSEVKRDIVYIMKLILEDYYE